MAKKTPLADLTIEELQQRQAELTARRVAVIEEARAVQAELDARAAELAAQRLADAERLGQQTRPLTQQAL
jgi:hypothetical protein